MDYATAKARHDELQAAADAASKAGQRFPKGPTGLTPDDVKASPEFRQMHAAYARAAEELRQFNKVYLKQFAREIRADRAAKVAARTVLAAATR